MTTHQLAGTERAERPPALKGPKRQHFLPRFLLQAFTGADGCMAVFDRGKNEIRRQQPLNTGAVGHLYTVMDDQGRQRFELEQALSEIEGAASIHLPMLISGEPLSFEARGALAHFFGTLAVRTPEFIQSIQHLNGQMIKATSQILFSAEDQVLSTLRGNPDHAKREDAELSVMARDMVDFVGGGDFEVDTDPQWAMTMALPMGEHIAQVMAERHWRVWQAPAKAAFIIGDAPVVLTATAPRASSFMGIGFGSTDALVLIPLSSTHAIAMYGERRSNDLRRVDRAIVRRLNIDIARRSQRFLIGRDNALVKSIAEAAVLAETIWKPKFGMNTP